MILIAFFFFDAWAFLFDEWCNIVYSFIVNVLNENDSEILTSININQAADILSFVLKELN